MRVHGILVRYVSLRKSPHVPSAYGVAVYPNIGLLAGKCTDTCQF